MFFIFDYKRPIILSNIFDSGNGKIIKSSELTGLPSAFDFIENDLNSFAVYTRVGRNVLRIHKIDKKIGLVEFNLISSGSPTDAQLSYILNNLLNNLDSIEERGVKHVRERNKNTCSNHKHRD